MSTKFSWCVAGLMSIFVSVTGILYVYESVQPGSSLFKSNTVAWGFAHQIIIAALNIIIASLITARLMYFRQCLRKTLGASQSSSVPYISIAAMVIESSMICALTYLALAIPYVLNSHVANIFLPSACLAQVWLRHSTFDSAFFNEIWFRY